MGIVVSIGRRPRHVSPLLAKHDAAVLDIGLDHIAVGELAVEHVEAERVEQVMLDGALERAGAVDRIVALVAEELLGRFA